MAVDNNRGPTIGLWNHYSVISDSHNVFICISSCRGGKDLSVEL